MRSKHLIVILGVLFLSGCASWFTSPTDSKGVTSFYVKSLHVNLKEGDWGKPNNRAFSSEETLSKDFAYSIQKSLVEHDVYAVKPDKHSAALVITIDYTRRYKYGGEALSRPLVSHIIQVYQHGQLIATLKRSNYSPINGFFSAIVINFMQAIHLWDKSDEHIDADNISASMIDQLVDKFDL